MSKKKAAASTRSGKKADSSTGGPKPKATAVKARPATKSERAKAGAAANPVEPKAVESPPPAPPAARAEAAANRQAPSASNQPGGRIQLPFKRPSSFNFAGVGRNDICPCGSGKRFKNCHGR
jgi:preprotein translocase subunit SecA